MFHSRKLHNKINKLHERCLQIAYSDNTSSFNELLETDNPVSVHYGNIQVLSTDLSKIVNGLSPEIMKESFHSMRIPLITQEIKESFPRGL